jgi:hypothetical protein
MDTFTSPVLLHYMVTNSRKVSVLIVAGTVVEKGRQYTELVLVRRPSKLVYASWSSELVLVSESVQCSSDSRIQEATSDNVFTIILTCVAAVNLHSE